MQKRGETTSEKPKNRIECRTKVTQGHLTVRGVFSAGERPGPRADFIKKSSPATRCDDPQPRNFSLCQQQVVARQIPSPERPIPTPSPPNFHSSFLRNRHTQVCVDLHKSAIGALNLPKKRKNRPPQRPEPHLPSF